MTDLYSEFASAMRQAGLGSKLGSRQHFCKVFAAQPQLAHVFISRNKDNFTRCSVCIKLEADVEAARKGHGGPAVLEAARAAKKMHIAQVRAEKLLYYRIRVRARARPTVLRLSHPRRARSGAPNPRARRRSRPTTDGWRTLCADASERARAAERFGNRGQDGLQEEPRAGVPLARAQGRR